MRKTAALRSTGNIIQLPVVERRVERRIREEPQKWKVGTVFSVVFLAVVVAALMALLMNMVVTINVRAKGSTFVRPTAMVEPEPYPDTYPETYPETYPDVVIVAEPQPVVKEWPQEEVEAIAKTVYGEALITRSDEEMSAVVWCILNRVDSPVFPDSIMGVVTAKSQFHGYSEDNPVNDHIAELVVDVLNRWDAERNGEENVGRTLPAEYLFFWGDGRHNHFTTEFLGGVEWDWSLQNPYDT